MEEEYEELKRENEEWHEDFDNLKEKYREVEKENDDMRCEVVQLRIENPECDELKGEIAALEIKNEDLDTKFTKLLDKNKEIALELEIQTKKNQKLEAEKKKFKKIEAQLKNLWSSRDDSLTQDLTVEN